MEFKYFKNLKVFYILIIFIFNFNFYTNNLNAENKNNQAEYLGNSLDNFNSKNKYLVGPGDKLTINFLGNKEFTGEYSVMSDGKISLPLIGTVPANYISIEKLTERIINLYKPELIRADIFIQLAKRRPVQVSVIGEVNRPGLYKLFNLERNNVPSSLNNPQGDFVNLPTVVDAISKAGGITPQSKLNSVIIKRRLDGGDLKYQTNNINLINLLTKGDQSQNLILFDGDIIEIQKVNDKNKMPSKILKIAKGNLSPKLIKINVMGAVEKPGEYNVKANTTLNKAILIANGFSPWKGSKKNIKLLRINNNGTISVKNYNFKINEQVSEIKNPPLIDGDLIKVNSTSFAKITGGLNEITNPLVNVLSSYSLFKLISE